MSHVVRSPEQLGTLIRRARRQRGMTQANLAGLTGLRQELVSRIETGHEGTKLSSIYALFAALNLELIVDDRNAKAAKDIEDIF